MLRTAILIILTALTISGCNNLQNKKMNMTSTESKEVKQDSVSGYAPVNGLNMYYEIHGAGTPLVLIHGGGSTIQTTFGRVLHLLAKNHRVIAVELQAHGHTADINRSETFEQDADDVAALLKYLKIENASFFGFSNGGHTSMEIAIRHPEIVNNLVIASAPCKRNGFVPGFFDGLQHATLANMPQELKTAFLKINPDTAKLQIMFNRDRERMIEFRDWSDEQIKSITAPTLLINGDADVITPEHAVEMMRLLPHARLSILPGTHGAYISEITTGTEHSKMPDLTVSMIEEFLNDPMTKKISCFE